MIRAVVAAVCLGLTAANAAEDIDTTNVLPEVNILKNELKKNNDDYVTEPPTSPPSGNLPTPGEPLAAVRRTLGEPPAAVRGTLGESPAKDQQPFGEKPIQPVEPLAAKPKTPEETYGLNRRAMDDPLMPSIHPALSPLDVKPISFEESLGAKSQTLGETFALPFDAETKVFKKSHDANRRELGDAPVPPVLSPSSKKPILSEESFDANRDVFEPFMPPAQYPLDAKAMSAEESLEGKPKSPEKAFRNRRALAGTFSYPARPALPTPSKSKKVGAVPAAAVRTPLISKKPVVVDQNKVDKLRTFLDKYKVIVSQFMANHSDAAAGGVPGVPGAPAGVRAGAPRGALAAPVSLAAAKGTLRSELILRNVEELPSGAQLDMSPARGGSIHGLRNKNRLCYRNVMVPEGPKYDSKGRIYLTEFARVRNRDYDATAAPHLLLPKCCNCCRKSVLGCE